MAQEAARRRDHYRLRSVQSLRGRPGRAGRATRRRQHGASAHLRLLAHADHRVGDPLHRGFDARAARKHVASLFCQHFAYDLPKCLDWDEIKEPAADHVIDTVTRFSPNFKGAVLRRNGLSPLDPEREFGLTCGDIFHGPLTPDQIWAARPVLGHANYRAPVAGLYLCGAGAHPGGGVSGLPGHNAAREILRDRRAGRLSRRDR